MANYSYPQNRNYVSILQFTAMGSDIINQFECVNGEVAGFCIKTFTDYETGKEIKISSIYDCLTGEAIYITSLQIEKDSDLVGGLFSSGVFPSDSNLDENTIYRKANY